MRETAEISKGPKDANNHLNISQLSREYKSVEVLYQQWKEGSYPETSDVLLMRITVFVNECRYVLNRGTVPRNPERKLADRTVKILETHMSKLSRISIDIKKTTSPKARLLSYRYERATYREASDSDPATPIEHIQKLSVRPHEKVKLGKRGVSRDFYDEIRSP